MPKKTRKPQQIQAFPVKLPKELHSRAMIKSEQTSIPVAVVIRAALEQWVEGKLKIKIAA